MIRFIFVTAIVLVLNSCSGPSHNMKELIDMELGRSMAIKRHDSTALNDMYADDFSGVAAGGLVVNKRALMEIFKKHNNELAFINDDHKVKFVDDRTAVLTGKLTAKDRSNNIVSISRFSHVLSFRNGKWQIVFGQGTIMPI